MDSSLGKMELRNTLEEFLLTDITDKGEELGHGACATVIKLGFRGLTCAGKRFYKTLCTGLNGEQSKSLQQRWCSECTLLGSLRHPNIVQFLGIHFEGDPLPVLVMEYVPFTLSHHLERQGTFPPEISYGILVDVARALCYLHGGSPTIVHRDLSANNILLTSEMRAKISDLGTAKILNLTPAQKASKMTACPGTLCYMPPEALTSDPKYSTDIDCFSYGVLTLHVLCREWPFPDEKTTTGDDGTQIVHTEVERRKQYIAKCGQDHPLMNLVQNCLSDVGGNRPDATEILRCVQSAAKQHPRHFDSILRLLEEIDTMTKQLTEANNRASKQTKDHRSQLATAQRTHDQEMKKLLKEIELMLSLGEKVADGQVPESVQEQTQTGRNEAQSDISLERSTDLTLIQTSLSRLVAERSRVEGALRVEKAKSQKRISELENTIKMIIQQQQNATTDLELKNKELNIKVKEVNALQAMSKAREEELESKSKELQFKERENQAIQKQTEVMQMLLEAQVNRIDAMASQVEEKQTQLKAMEQKVNETATLLKIHPKEIELLHHKSSAVEEGLRSMVDRKECLLEDVRGEMEVIRKCEIPALESRLEMKEDIIQELVEQHQRVQEKLAKQEIPFNNTLKFVFKPLSDLPVAMSDLHCAVIDNSVYVGGGTGDNKSDHASQAQIFKYDDSDDKWTLLTRTPTRFFGLVHHKERLATIGGMCSNNCISGDVSVFDLETKLWKDDEISPLAIKRFHPSVLSYRSRLAVVGGVTVGGSTVDNVEVYVDGQWHKAPSLPHRICLAKLVIFGDSLYLIGGLFSCNPEVPSKAVISIPLSKLFTPQTETKKVWKIISPEDSLTLHYRSAAANLGGMLFAVGGWSQSLIAPTTDIVAYSLSTNMWVRVRDGLPQPRCSCGATAQLQNGQVMLVGGIEKNANEKKRSANVLLASLVI